MLLLLLKPGIFLYAELMMEKYCLTALAPVAANIRKNALRWLPYNPIAKRSKTPGSLQEIRFDDLPPEWHVDVRETRITIFMMEDEQDLELIARLRPHKIRWREPSATRARGHLCHEHRNSKTQMHTKRLELRHGRSNSVCSNGIKNSTNSSTSS